MVPVEISGPMTGMTASVSPARTRRKAGLIEIDLGDGRCIRVDRGVDAEALRRVLDVLDRR
jgi:transposase